MNKEFFISKSSREDFIEEVLADVEINESDIDRDKLKIYNKERAEYYFKEYAKRYEDHPEKDLEKVSFLDDDR